MATRVESLTIANGAAVTSTGLSTNPHEKIVAIIVPSTWTAADIGFQISDDGGTTYYDVVDGTRAAATSFARLVNVATGAAALYVVPAVLDLELGSLWKLTSVNTASNVAVNQGAARTLKVVIEKRY